MVPFKKAGVLFTTTALSLSLFSATAAASTPMNEPFSKVQIQVANTETTVTKEQLIKKFNKLFPNQYSFLKSSDFHMSGAHHYPNDDTVRYELMFDKTVNGKQVYGNATFAGEKLDLEYFYYSPADTSDALFPAKVSKAEAQKTAENLLKKFADGESYKLDENSFNYFPQQLLTEPIQYVFSFVRTSNDIPIADQRIDMTILGNGELTSLYKSQVNVAKATFEDEKNKKAQADVLEQVKNALSVRLQYQVDYDYFNDERTVKLVYKPNTESMSVNAVTGKWQNIDGKIVDTLQTKAVQPLATAPLPPKQKGITIEQAKKLAQNLLAIQSDKIKLAIHSIDQVENMNGRSVFSISYMYETPNGGSGSNLEIDAQTGEIIQFQDLKDDLLLELNDEGKTNGATLTEEVALAKAVDYLKTWLPSYVHQYAKPIHEPYFDKDRGTYYFSFPRIVNGITVTGDEINVGIDADGTLDHIYVGYQELEWPAVENVISEQQAKQAFIDHLNLKLEYLRLNSDKENHYGLMYTPMFNNDSYSSLDATTGEWTSLFGSEKLTTVVSHPTAEAELNYLIGAKILQVKDVATFNADASITQGEALSIIMKSLTHFYKDYYSDKDNIDEPIGSVDASHPLYSVVERAVALGVLDESATGFKVDATLTRQQLAEWYIRILNLEIAAEHHEIYKLNFADAKSVDAKYAGYVALANALGILQAEQNNFNPTKEVSYAQLAVSTIKLAKEINKQGIQLYYYY